jgi:hypothetical protein
MSTERLTRVFDLAYECLRRKINGGRIRVDNEASLQLQFAAILKAVGELLEVDRNEYFSIELEKRFRFDGVTFGKSQSDTAKIDIFFSYTNIKTSTSEGCAIELKLFWKRNHREPNNRYDVFNDIRNLESYGGIAKCCFMVVGTDHEHYVSQTDYSPDTADFDFRHGKKYFSETAAEYRTSVLYGEPIVLAGDYAFSWDTASGGLHFLKLAVQPVHLGTASALAAEI